MLENYCLEIRKQLIKYKNVQSLMRYINKITLKKKFDEQLGNKATGVDKVTKAMYEEKLDENIDNLLDRMKELKYKPLPVKRAFIEKANGQLRPLGLPSFEDKLVQGVMADILNEIYEPIFLDCSYGFRPNRDCHQAIKKLDKILMNRKTNFVVEADIKGFFDNVNHEWLMKFLKHIIKDKVFLRYIKRFLIAGVMNNGVFEESEKGTPQGGLISPILANVYLHYVLDLWFKLYIKIKCKGECSLVRYADDFVACFEYEEDAYMFYEELIERLAKFDLEIEPSKSRIFPFGRNSDRKESFDFLGFTIQTETTRNGYFKVGYKTSKKKSKLKFKAIKEKIKQNRTTKPKDLIKMLNKILIGYYNYYGISFNFEWLNKIYIFTIMQLKKWLSRRSQKGDITWEKMWRILDYEPLVKPRITYSLW